MDTFLLPSTTIPIQFLLSLHPCICGRSLIVDQHSCSEKQGTLFTQPCLDSSSVFHYVLEGYILGCSFYILNKCKELKNWLFLFIACPSLRLR